MVKVGVALLKPEPGGVDELPGTFCILYSTEGKIKLN